MNATVIVVTHVSHEEIEYMGIDPVMGNLTQLVYYNTAELTAHIEYQFLVACVNEGLPHPAIDRLNPYLPTFDENEELYWEGDCDYEDVTWECYDPAGCQPEYESPFPDYHGEEFRACSELWTRPTPAEWADQNHGPFVGMTTAEIEEWGAEEIEESSAEFTLEADIEHYLTKYAETMDEEAYILATFAIVDQLTDAGIKFRVSARLLEEMRQAEERVYGTSLLVYPGDKGYDDGITI